MNIPLKNEGEMKTFSDSKPKRICHQKTYPKQMATGSFMNRKEIILRRNLETSGRKINRKSKMSKYNILFCFLSFKLRLMAETKIVIPFKFSIVKGIFKTIINGGDKVT